MEATIKIFIGNTANNLIQLLVILIVFSSFSYSQNTIIYDDEFKSTDLDTILEYYEDISGQLTIKEILSSDEITFKSLGTYKNLGFTKSSFWVRFKVKKCMTKILTTPLILRVNDPEVNIVDFYQISSNKKIIKSSFSGNLKPIENRFSPTENVNFFVAVPKNEINIFYLRIASENPIMLDFSLNTMQEFSKISRLTTLLIGLFLGIFLFVVAYYFILYTRIRESSFLYLSLAGLSLLINFIAATQFGYVYIWPGYFEWNRIVISISDTIMISLFLKFIYEFLELKKYMPRIYILFNLIYSIFFIFFLLVLFIDLFYVSQFINLFIIISLIIILVISFLSFVNGYKPAKFIFIGIILISITGIYNIITEFGILPVNNIASYGFLAASVFLVWFFSQAVSIRINMIKSEKEKMENELMKSEKHFSLVVKGTNLGTWNWDIQTGKINCNDQIFEMLGMKNNEIEVNLEVWENMIHPDDKEKVLTLLMSHVKGEISSYKSEYRIKHKSGKWIWIVARGKVVEFDNHDQPLHAVGTILDITDRKRAEITQQVILNIANAVSTSKNMYEFYKTVHEQINKLFEAKNFQVALYDDKDDVLLLPYSMDEFDKYEMIPASKTCSAYVLKTKKAVLLKSDDIKRLVEEGEIEIYGTPSKIWLGIPLKVDKKIIGLIFIQSYDDENAYDENDLQLMEFVSDQIASSIARKQSEEQIRILSRSVEQSPASIVITDLEGNIEYVNPKFTEVTGYTLNEVKGKNPRILKSDQTPKEYHKNLWETISDGLEWKGEFLNKKKNGELYWELAYIAPIKNETGLTTHFLAVKEDISERKRTDEELSKARNYINNILNSMPSIVIGVDKDISITHWNQEAEKLTGLSKEQATGQPLEKVMPQLYNEVDNIRKSINSRQLIKENNISNLMHNQSQYSDLTVYPLISNGVEGAVIRIDDVTERVRLQEMMIQSEKMLSVGGLAAGMAHEINNPLAGMLQNAQVILNRLTQKMQKNDEVAKECNTTFEAIQTFMEKRKIIEMLHAINITGKRASKIVENMLSFSRKSESRFSSHDIRKILNDTIELAASDYDLKKKYDFRKIKIIKEYDEELPLVNCERSNIQQVFLNVLRNGAQAMIESENKREEPCFTFRVKQEKDMVRIEIEDNGPGMDEESRRRAFEPFYTTKEVSDGTGLGLSVSYFIITEQHKGRMFIESKKGKGTGIVIYLKF